MTRSNSSRESSGACFPTAARCMNAPAAVDCFLFVSCLRNQYQGWFVVCRGCDSTTSVRHGEGQLYRCSKHSSVFVFEERVSAGPVRADEDSSVLRRSIYSIFMSSCVRASDRAYLIRRTISKTCRANYAAAREGKSPGAFVATSCSKITRESSA